MLQLKHRGCVLLVRPRGDGEARPRNVRGPPFLLNPDVIMATIAGRGFGDLMVETRVASRSSSMWHSFGAF